MAGLGSTWIEIIKAINEGGSGGSGIPKLTTQTVSIADLDAGVYLWDYNGEKTLDYISGTKQIYKNPTFLQINSNGGTQKDFYLFDNAFGADDNDSQIIWGSVDREGTNEGWCWSKFLKDIPTPDENETITLEGRHINLYAEQSDGSVEILAGGNDNTRVYISNYGVEVTVNNRGYVNFTSADDISFYSKSGSVSLKADNSMSFHAEYGDIVFETDVVFSTAPKIGESNVATEEFVTTKINEILGAIENGSY